MRREQDLRRLFGTDGVRGVANQPPMTVETALEIGKAVAHLYRKNGRGRIFLGKDTRLSGYMFETALAAGITSMGSDVWLGGPLPTPAIAHLTTSMRADAGIVVSASHNPYEDNGIKIFGGDGFKLPDEQEVRIERLLGSAELASARPGAADIGKATRIDDARGRYVGFLKSLFPRDLSLEGLRVVVDCAHGAAYRVAPAVLEELGAEVFPIGVHPDGKNINARVGALHPDGMARSVLTHGAHLGVALDGDADRALFVDETGRLCDGDEVMAILATRMLADKRLPKRTLVATVMSNLGLERAIERAGGTLLRTAVGDRYVVEAMREGGYAFGGEQSGHLICLEHSTTGDGMVAALQLLAVMRRERRPLSELRRVMRRVPQVLENVVVARRRPLESLPKVQVAIRAVEKRLGRDGRVLVRYSGTEPKVRVMIEGPTQKTIRAAAREIGAAIAQECGA